MKTTGTENGRLRVFIRRSYGIWLAIPTVQICTAHPFFGGEVELRWLLWGVVFRREIS